MSRLFEELGIAQWSVDERLALIEEIWASIAAKPEEFVLSEAQKKEIQRRLDLYAANPDAGSTWEDVEARIRQRRGLS